MGQVSLRLSGSLITASLNMLTLFRSSLNDNDLKTTTGIDISEKKLMILCEFCSLVGEKT